MYVCVCIHMCAHAATSTKSLTLSDPLVFPHIDCSFKHTFLPRAPIFLPLCSPEDLLGNLGTGCLATKIKVFDEYNLGGGGGERRSRNPLGADAARASIYSETVDAVTHSSPPQVKITLKALGWKWGQG